MNSMEYIQRRSNFKNHLMKWPLLCGWLGLALARATLAADALYQNDAIVSYPGTTSFAPVIDATNFVNNGTFIINFTFPGIFFGQLPPQPYYETSDTLNYTNSDNGLMIANSGFQFDNQSSSTGLRTLAGSFYNSGTISCGSINNTSDPMFGLLDFYGFAQCFINATNIINPGTVDVGVNGGMQFVGQNMDLSRSTLNIEGSGANAFGTGVFGLNTNGWDPSLNLGRNFAESSFFPIAPFFLDLFNSTSYFDFTTQVTATTTNNIIRAVFIEDTSPTNVSYKVYFDNEGNLGLLGADPFEVTIEWTGSYVDVASGNSFNNYLYLHDNYALGAATNVLLTVNGYPDNFAFTESSTPLFFGVPPATAEFLNVFPAGSISNRYAFANVQLLSTTQSTNNIPNHSVTNLPGRIQISATNELNLAYAQITGPNYMSVRATNQFDGSPGALIQASYSDLNLGRTDGILTISNLLAPTIPVWSGTVQAWTTRWLVTATNSMTTTNGGVVTTNSFTSTNDYRVLIVGSQLNPTTLAQVQDLILHGTNSIVISDAFNIMRTLNADAQNLTLTTNGIGIGATSVDGELNVETPNIFWGSSLPNLRNLTNNGAIRFQNLVQFAGNSNIVTVTPATPAAAATGTLSEVAGTTNVMVNNQVTIGSVQYTFVGKLTNTVANQIKLATTFDGSLNNLIAAINHDSGAGTAYSTNTSANPLVKAGFLTNHSFTVTNRATGPAGNFIVTTNSATTTNLTWNGHATLLGGVNFVAGTTNVSPVSVPYYNFINNSFLSDQGAAIWANNFVNSGTIANGVGSFSLQSLTTTLTNGSITTIGNASITTGSLIASNVVLSVGKALTLAVTNLLTDTGVTNGNNWSVGALATSSSPGIYLNNGFNLPILPTNQAAGDLRGTTVMNIAPSRKLINNLWAGQNRGGVPAGYTNNVAVGQLFLDALDLSTLGTQFYFSGTGASNALYVDRLVLLDYASYTNHDANGNIPTLAFNTNLVIFYAAAVASGQDVSDKLNGANNNHLRWVPTYAGYFSSTNIVYPDGTTNTFNSALAQSTSIDSDQDGIVNANDPTPFFVANQVKFTLTLTNISATNYAKLSWQSIPSATNSVYYTTNLVAPGWQVLTNFVTTNSASPATITFLDKVNPALPRYYRVLVSPNNLLYYGF